MTNEFVVNLDDTPDGAEWLGEPPKELKSARIVQGDQEKGSISLFDDGRVSICIQDDEAMRCITGQNSEGEAAFQKAKELYQGLGFDVEE